MTTFSLPAPELGRILSNVSLAASKDKGRPILCCLQVQLADGVLTVSASDSYWLLRETFTVEGEGAFTALLPVADLAPVIKAAKAWDVAHLPAAVTVEGEKVTFKVAALTLTVDAYPGEFPNLERLLEGRTPNAVDTVGLNATILDELSKVAPSLNKVKRDDVRPIRFTFDGAHKPVRIEWKKNDGGELFGLLMPVVLP